MNKQHWVYIITNKNNTVLYTGVTGDLKKRVYERRNKLAEGFSKRYNLSKLVYYEPKGIPRMPFPGRNRSRQAPGIKR